MCKNFFEKVVTPLLLQRYQQEAEASKSLILVLLSAKTREGLPSPLHITNICKIPGTTRALAKSVVEDIEAFVKSHNLSSSIDYTFSIMPLYFNEDNEDNEDVEIVIFKEVE